jgi:hypothetical protein
MEAVAVEKTVKEAATFEIRAQEKFTDGPEGTMLYALRILHFCPTRGGKSITIEEGWARCPWCSRSVPKRIREVFE